tara:strand:+ start:338 stop:475 length:138 start_codon:yes stop_codon:yes gene_type:complete
VHDKRLLEQRPDLLQRPVLQPLSRLTFDSSGQPLSSGYQTSKQNA